MSKGEPEATSSENLSSPSSLSLGDFSLYLPRFNIKELFNELLNSDFYKLSDRKRLEKLMRLLLEQVLEAPQESFLLAAVIEFLAQINEQHLLHEHLQFYHWEFWLNNFSGLNDQAQAHVRGKIVGKFVPRETYQPFFPIGTGKSFFGSHIVAAHLSPDVDTMIASFWGWVDAFAARVGSSQHHWSLPGGAPDTPVTKVFEEIFGKDLFSILARTSTILSLTAIDLVTQSNLTKEVAPTSINTLDHGFSGKAVLLVDEQDLFLGDWRSNDVELVRQVIILFKSCLHWFENNFHIRLVSFFAKPHLKQVDVPLLFEQIFCVPIGQCEPALEFLPKQQQDLDLFIQRVLGLPQGLMATFSQVIDALEGHSMVGLGRIRKEMETLKEKKLFDPEGNLIENRSQIFHFLERIIIQLDHAVHYIRNYVERLDLAIQIKRHVVGAPSPTIALRSDIDEMQAKIRNYDYLTVVYPEDSGRLLPVGVVWASDLRRQSLGTVSFRDFSNVEEVRMAPYLTPISLVDHHKSQLTTTSVATMIIGDAQSCNVLVAEVTLGINDRYSLGGMTPLAIERQIEETIQGQANPQQDRILSRLLKKQRAARHRERFFVHPLREFTEYLCYLYAILDDTDLLTKVTPRDVDCVAELLNRMKSIASRKEEEVINLDNLPRDRYYAREAARRILQNPEMYSLYRRIYQFREQEVEINLKNCSQGESSNLFSDTKEQNGCCRVGQTKLFSHNIPLFHQKAELLRSFWLKSAKEIYQARNDIDFHLHMISTIPSAEEVYRDMIGHYHHLDELWFWVPHTQRAYDHLASFLYAFQSVPEVIDNYMELQIVGPMGHQYQELFEQNFLPIATTLSHDSMTQETVAILRYQAGTLNSRKALISPYLPRLLS